MLKIDGVTRRFGEVTALDGVSLEIGQGEFFALLGPSGCGKTTLLRIIAGFETPDSGTVTLDGEDLLGKQPNRRPISLMFQSYALFPHMTVAKNVAYGLEREKLSRQEIKQRVGEVLETVGLTAHAGRKPAAAVRRPAPARRAGALHRQAPAPAPAGRAAVGAWTRRSARTCSWSSSGCSTRSASPSWSSPTTRRRPCRWPTASRSSTTAGCARWTSRSRCTSGRTPGSSPTSSGPTTCSRAPGRRGHPGDRGLRRAAR